MKLLRCGAKGKEKPAIVDAEGNIRDLSSIVSDITGEVLEYQLDTIYQADLTKLPKISSQERIGSCVGNVGKFICIGLNYSDHAAETGADIPSEPVIFNKWTSAISGPNDDIEIP